MSTFANRAGSVSCFFLFSLLFWVTASRPMQSCAIAGGEGVLVVLATHLRGYYAAVPFSDVPLASALSATSRTTEQD